jgi:phosphoglycolate phosphatase
LIFDLDGTLIDSLPDLAAALNRLMVSRGLAVLSPAEIAPMIGDGVHKLVERAFTARGRAPDPQALAAFTADYNAHTAVETKPYPNVEATLQLLADQGWIFALCTNKTAAATELLLSALGLTHWFKAIGAGDSFPTCKPDPRHLVATIAAAGCDRSRSIMVGDHANDIAAAAGAGVPSIFAAWGYGSVVGAAAATAVARHFADIIDIAPRLLPAVS